MKVIMIWLVFLILLCSYSWAQQSGTLHNSSQTGDANTAVTVTIPAVRFGRAHIYGLDAWCSAGTATLSITDGGTTIWTTQTGEIGMIPMRIGWVPDALTGQRNSEVIITLTTCGAGNTGTLIVQADRY